MAARRVLLQPVGRSFCVWLCGRVHWRKEPQCCQKTLIPLFSRPATERCYLLRVPQWHRCRNQRLQICYFYLENVLKLGFSKGKIIWFKALGITANGLMRYWRDWSGYGIVWGLVKTFMLELFLEVLERGMASHGPRNNRQRHKLRKCTEVWCIWVQVGGISYACPISFWS